jgi:uncharacterized membrane protein
MSLILSRRKIIYFVFLLILFFLPVSYAQDGITPLSLDVKIYTDGSTLVTYRVECEPSAVRVNVSIFGETYGNLVIRDEEGLPLDSTKIDSVITVDSLGASELTIVYSTSDLTTKEGPIWDFNLSSPIRAKITLPQGAAILDMSDIPLDIGIVSGAQYVVLPSGEIYLSFILSLPNLDVEAQEAIDEAESYLTTLENQGYILLDAREELTSAQQLYENNQFSNARDMANQAIETADETVDLADAADVEIVGAEIKISQAEDEGRTVGLTQAEETLASAEAYYLQGLYLEASTAAKQAAQLALSADSPDGGNLLLYLSVLGVILVAVGVFYYIRKQREQETTSTRGVVSEFRSVNLEKIFQDHDLRMEDREVLRYLAENNGEAFATEIRDRFDMPRSSAWRLIRRLISLNIVEEVKVGNQSLVKIKGKYLS